MDELIRWYNVAVAAAVIIAGTARVRQWVELDIQERLHWQASALLNLGVLIGAAESLSAGYPGGVRIYIIAVGLTWLLHALLHRPLSRALTRRRRHAKERP